MNLIKKWSDEWLLRFLNVNKCNSTGSDRRLPRLICQRVRQGGHYRQGHWPVGSMEHDDCTDLCPQLCRLDIQSGLRKCGWRWWSKRERTGKQGRGRALFSISERLPACTVTCGPLSSDRCRGLWGNLQKATGRK